MNLWRKYLDDEGLEATHGIIGVDPGGTTGLFVCVVYSGRDEHLEQWGVIVDKSQVIRSDQPEAHVGYLLKILKDCGVPSNRLHVAIEKYIITKRTAKLTQQPDALEITGSVKAMAEKHGAHVWQFTPSQTKKFASDDLLDRVGWFPRKGNRMRHARDAARQVWTCLAEVDFASWERNWECASRVTDGGELITMKLNETIFSMDKENRSESD